MSGYFSETSPESWSLDNLAEWCYLNVSCDKKKILDSMKKSIQDVRDNPVSDYAKLKADYMFMNLEPWKSNKSKGDYFKCLENLKKIRNDETLQLAQIKSEENIRMAKIKSKHLQEHTTTVVEFHKNIADDLTTIDRDVKPARKKPTRKRKSICYTESSEEDHSSDPDYTEKLKRKQEPRSKRSRGKTSFDDTDKGVIDPSVETSEIPSPGDTSYEITPSTSIKNTISKQYVREKYYSRESTPCPTTHDFTDPFIITPNKPVITKSSYNQYPTHIICAFGSALHLVKETTEKELYEEIEKILKMRNKSVLNTVTQ